MPVESRTWRFSACAGVHRRLSNPAPSSSLSAEQLERLSIPDATTELVRGHLVIGEAPSTGHGRIQANLHYFVMDHARKNRAAVVFGQETGFKLHTDPDPVRGLIAEVLSPGARSRGRRSRTRPRLPACF